MPRLPPTPARPCRAVPLLVVVLVLLAALAPQPARAVVCPGTPRSDPFAGPALDPCRWTVLRPVPSALAVAEGELRIAPRAGDLDDDGVSNLVVQAAPAGDWTVRTRVTLPAGTPGRRAGLVLRAGPGDLVRLVLADLDGGGRRRVELLATVGGQTPRPGEGTGVWHTGDLPAGTTGTVDLVLERRSGLVRGRWSTDGAEEAAVGTAAHPSPAGSAPVLGLAAYGGTADEPPEAARFDRFLVEPDDVTPPVVAARLDPDAPGPGGVYAGPVTVVLTGEDEPGGSGLERLEYALDGGPATVTAGPVATVTVAAPGTHTVAYRAVDRSGNASAEATVVFTIAGPPTTPGLAVPDTTPPTTVAGVRFGGVPARGGWRRGPARVTLVATDVGGVGVDRVEWSLDGGPPQVYAAPLTVAADGEHVVAFRAVDAAGNVEPTRTVAFRLDGSAPRVAPAGLRPGARYGDAGRVFPTVATTDAGSGVASLRVTLDGRPVSLGAALWLYRLPLGEHALRITALDLAGNATRRTVRFRTVTSFKDLARLVRRFRDDGRLGPRGRVVAATLGRELAVARRLAGARRRPAARRALARFAAAAAQARDGTARRVLRRDAAAVARALR